MRNFDELINFFGTPNDVLSDILLMDNIEKSAIMRKLALNYENDIQFKNTMEAIIK
jgi:hypothetical protein